jgi:capsular exopolysaccharide synthesis family protein
MSRMEEGSEEERIDLDKVWLIIRKNMLWIFLIILATNALAYIYLRYTRPVYESSSVIKLDIKSEANILGLNTVNQNLDHIAGEIELLKSNMFFSRVVDAMAMDVSYYAYGRVLFQERYDNSPFKVEYELHDPSWYDQPVDVEILNDEKFVLSYGQGEAKVSRTFRFGEEITLPQFKLLLSLTAHYQPDLDNTKYYFIINSHLALVNYLGNNLIVEPVNFNANTIRVGFRGYDRKKVRDLVHVIDSVYLRYTQEKKNQATEQILSFLDEQLYNIEQRLSKHESYFENFTIDNKTNNLETEIGEAIVKMEALDVKKYELYNTQKAVSGLSDKVANEEIILTEPASFTNYPEDILKSVEQLNTFLNERTLMLGSYKENTFAVKRKNQQIALLKKEIVDLLEKYNDEMAQEVKAIDGQKKKIEDEFVLLPSKGTEYGKNQRYYNLYEEIFLSLVQKKNEMEITKAGTVTDFVVLLPATVPNDPIAPARVTVYGIGAISGLIISLAFVAMGYIFNNKINSQSELERLVAAPVLGAIPYYSKVKYKKSKLVVSQSPKSSVSEAFRAIRTNIQFLGIHGDKKIISVTSTVGSEGKTFFASNLGHVISMSGKKVVLVDVDLRKPKVHTVFDHENGMKGVSTFLIGEYPIQECILHSQADHFDFIPAGPVPPNPSELITSKQFDAMLDELKKLYDIVIVDTPPVGLVTDGMLIMEKADLPVYVFRADFSKRTFTKTLQKVKNTHKFHNITVVLNALKTTSDRDYGYHKYGYGYYDDEHESKSLWTSLVNLGSKKSTFHT